MTSTFDLATLVLILEGILYALMAVIALRRRGFQEQAARWLILYAAVSSLWTLGQTVWEPGRLPLAADAVRARVLIYGVLLLSWLFLHLTRAFLRLERAEWIWWAFGVAWAVVLAVLDSNLPALPETLWSGNGWIIQRQGLAFGLLIAGWAVFMSGAALLTVRAYRRTQQPLHRNRITYWSLALGFTVAGDALLFAGHSVLGGILRLAGVLIATHAVATHHLPDVRQTVRRMLSYLLITLLTVGLYTSGFVAMQVVFQAVPGYSPLLAGAAMALILAILFQPLLGLVQRLVNRLISGVGYDPNRMLHEFSLSISDILDLELLANVMVNLISDTMKIRHGRLFLVDRRKGESGKDFFHLREVGSKDKKEAGAGALAADGPIAGYLSQEHHVLTQYDMDLLARFQATSPEEHAWMSSLDADVYLPIHSKGDWVGLLALGPKVSGDRYFDDDLSLLRTLADQTAVAFENARLIEDLIRAHSELGQTYAALAQANLQLQELDRLKSAFIGVITHELRTPFANIVFSLELLGRHGRKHLPPELDEQMEQLATGVQLARTMVDNLVTFATFLSKQGKLHLSPLDFGQVVRDSLLPLKSVAEVKGVTLCTEVPEGMPPLQGDQERLGDAVYHLVHNAIKFTGAGGEVRVRCRATDNAVRFEVEDTGVGVAADKLPALWESFAQMADPLRRGVEGLGLGLALVKYIVNAHGGDVWASSEEGEGSTFGFQIPLRGRSA